jgi:acyl-CoA synthetase (AMP-forming)/AMP-acid ligase II
MLGNMMDKQLTIGSLIQHGARWHAAAEVVSVETTGGLTRSTWGEVERRARMLASALGRLGIGAGERCGTIAWNNLRHLEIYFGVSGGGMVCHTLNPRLFPEQVIYIANHAQDRVMFVDRTFLPIVAKLREHLKTVEHVVLMGPPDDEALAMLPDLIAYEDLIAAGDPAYQWPEIDEHSASSLCYTSGTTGNPKGVLYSHRSTVLHSLFANSPDGLNISARDVVLPVVPMFHVNAWGVPYAAAAIGCKLVLPGPGLDGDSLIRLITGEKVTTAFGVPTIWLGLLAALDRTGAALPTLSRSVVGGSALPPSMFASFRDRHGVDMVHAWGMTETSPLGTINQLLLHHAELDPAEQQKLRTTQGRPPYGVDLRLVDDEGRMLPHDGATQGRLQIRGPWIVSRYFGAEGPATTEDGWFDSGDVATINPEGFMSIRDRAKDIIKSGGEWISTVELENIAIGHPGIANAAAIAARHEKWDERPVIIAIRKPGAEVAEEDLIGFYDGRVARWQVPDKVIFVDALPIGATGKILKNKLRDDYGDCLISP